MTEEEIKRVAEEEAQKLINLEAQIQCIDPEFKSRSNSSVNSLTKHLEKLKKSIEEEFEKPKDGKIPTEGELKNPEIVTEVVQVKTEVEKKPVVVEKKKVTPYVCFACKTAKTSIAEVKNCKHGK